MPFSVAQESAALTVTITGDDKVDREFDRLAKLDPAKASMAMASVVFSDSQQNVPVVTSRLKSSGLVVQVGQSAELRYMADYAAYVEFGTSKMAARGYVRRALDNHQRILDASVKVLKRDMGLK